MDDDNKDAREVNESSITRLMRHNEEHDCICITAYRSDRENDEDGVHVRKARMSNQTANHALGAVLKRLGYDITKVVGQYPETIVGKDGSTTTKIAKEMSWFVVNVNDDGDFLAVCADLAERDSQDSILFIPKGTLKSGKGCYIYGTSSREKAWPEYHQKVLTDGIKVNGNSQYSTKIDGKEFAFDLVAEDADGLGSFGSFSSQWGGLAKHSYIKNHYGIDIFNIKKENI